MRIQVEPKDLQIILEILKADGLHQFAFAFGSRVRGDHKRYSDLDIVIKAPKALSIQQMSKLEVAFSASDLPFKVDVVDWFLISDDFKSKIEPGMILLNDTNSESTS